jgi:hypothetical protein
MSSLEVARIPRCDPVRFTRVEAGVLARGWPRPLLVLAGLGEPALLVGRHQRARAAVDVARARERGLPVVRRAGGGRNVVVGDGVLAMFLWVPPSDPLVSGPVAPDRLLARHLRGLLAGLRASGARGAAYFGRDLVSADGRQLALASEEATAAGGIAFEALVSLSRAMPVPDAFTRYPAARDARTAGPRPVTLEELRGSPAAFDAVAAAIEQSYAAAHDREAIPARGVLPEIEPPPVEEDEQGLAGSGLVEVPIGFVEALAAPFAGALHRVRIRGDLLAPAFLLEALEAELEGARADPAEILARVDAAFRRPGAFLHGAPERAIADAIAEAANGVP